MYDEEGTDHHRSSNIAPTEIEQAITTVVITEVGETLDEEAARNIGREKVVDYRRPRTYVWQELPKSMID